MSRFTSLAILSAALIVANTHAQTPAAAKVNGHVIPQKNLDRALERFSESDRVKARAEILDFLIDNALVDQYLALMKVTAEPKEIEARNAEIIKEIEMNGQTKAKVLASLKMTEEEFDAQVINDLKWEKFANGQATDMNLKALFDQSPEMFDGSMVRARHILLSPAADAAAQQTARTELTAMRKQIEAKAAEAVAKLPATADALTRDQERQKHLEAAFADMAKEKSTCGTKRDGGDVSWFPRAGSLVENFSRAAFALKPFEMSEPVQTQFGWHLILCVGRKPGTAVKFEEVKEEVKEIYCNRLREAITAHMRKTAKIEVTPAR